MDDPLPHAGRPGSDEAQPGCAHGHQPLDQRARLIPGPPGPELRRRRHRPRHPADEPGRLERRGRVPAGEQHRRRCELHPHRPEPDDRGRRHRGERQRGLPLRLQPGREPLFHGANNRGDRALPDPQADPEIRRSRVVPHPPLRPQLVPGRQLRPEPPLRELRGHRQHRRGGGRRPPGRCGAATGRRDDPRGHQPEPSRGISTS